MTMVRQPQNMFAQAVILLTVAVLIQIVSFKAIYLSLAAGFGLSIYCVLRCHFVCLPALIVLYARSSSVLLCILSMAFVYVLALAVQRKFNYLWRFPDILIFPLLLLVVSMTVAACNRSGYYWNEIHLYELWSVFGLFAFYYGMLLYRTVTPKLMQLLLPVGLFVFLVEIAFRQEEDSKSYARQIFYWGPFFVSLFVYRIKKWNLIDFGFSILGCLLFVATMIVGLPTLTLQGSAVYAASVVMFAPFKNSFTKLSGHIWTSWTVFMIIAAVMVYGVLNMETQSVARDRGQSEHYVYSFASFSGEFLERFRAKMFDDRAVLWRAVWNDVNTPPYFWRPTDERFIRGVEDAMGQYFDFYEIPPHNIYLGALLRMRWPAGLLFLILYCTMIMRAGKLLFVRSAGGLWIVISATTVVVGVFGGFTGDFTMTFTFNFPFMALAGLCYAHYLNCKQRHPVEAFKAQQESDRKVGISGGECRQSFTR